jgi:segregation and condensation protein B
LSRAALETLAIVAYRQPIMRAEIESLRGVDCGGVLRLLLERRLIRVMGRKEIPGRPLIYGTTRQFLEVFELRDLKDLPTLKEIRELAPEAPQAVPPAEARETSGNGKNP